MAPPLVLLNDVYKWAEDGAGRTEILKGVSMEVKNGEFMAIMGASGSGKSTLLNLLGLLDVPSAGSLQLWGKEVSGLNDDQLAPLRARSIGFIFQNFNLMPYLTVQENIELGMLYSGHANRGERSRELLVSVELQHRASAYPQTLSGGERQRVAIARALANRPALILADEPTGALDSKTGEQILSLIRQLHRQGTTVILVTHDENVARLAQRRLQMRDGRFV
jgi:putative ABC transport system ATP-binding protein